MRKLVITKNTEKYNKKTGEQLWKVCASTWTHDRTRVLIRTLNSNGINEVTLDGKTARIVFNTLKRHYKSLKEMK